MKIYSPALSFLISTTILSTSIVQAQPARITSFGPYRIRTYNVSFDGSKPVDIAKVPAKKTPTAFESLPDDSKVQFNNETVFSHYMGFEDVHHAFRLMQWEMLNTDQDAAFTHHFYFLNQVIPGLFDTFQKIHTQELEYFSRHAMANYSRLIHSSQLSEEYRSKHNSKDDIIDKIIELAQSAALRMGFPPTSIKNIEIYTSNEPGMNAFTVSGNSERLIIVLNTDLIKNMSPEELQAVIYHELGHIRSLHSVKSAMHSLLINLVFQNFLPTQISSFSINDSPFFENITTLNHVCAHHKAVENKSHMPQAQFKNQVAKIMNRAIQVLNSQAPTVKMNQIVGYIKLLIDVLRAEKGSPETIQYFQSLLIAITQPALALLKPNLTDMQKHFMVALQAISRAQEKSSDSYMTALAKNEDAALAIAKLVSFSNRIGIDDSIPDERKILSMKLQKEMFDKMTAGTDISNEVGTTHPSPTLRVDRILNTQSYPSILFADSFLRLLMLEDMLSSLTRTESTESRLTALRSDISRLLERYINSNSRFNKLVQYFTFNKALSIQMYNEYKSSEAVQSEENKKIIESIEIDLKQQGELVTFVITKMNEINSASGSAALRDERKRRIDILERALKSNSPEELAQIQLVAKEDKLNIFNIPQPDQVKTLSNPRRQKACEYLLMAAAQANAQKEKEAAASSSAKQ